MQDNVRDLVHAGIYLCAIAALTGGVALGVNAAYHSVAANPGLNAIAEAQDRQDQEVSRISINVQTARTIRAALARPIPRPEPLPPITATVAHPPRAIVAHKPAHPEHRPSPKISAEAINAMAMDVPQVTSANPEFGWHKVY